MVNIIMNMDHFSTFLLFPWGMLSEILVLIQRLDYFKWPLICIMKLIYIQKYSLKSRTWKFLQENIEENISDFGIEKSILRHLVKKLTIRKKRWIHLTTLKLEPSIHQRTPSSNWKTASNSKKTIATFVTHKNMKNNPSQKMNNPIDNEKKTWTKILKRNMYIQ